MTLTENPVLRSCPADPWVSGWRIDWHEARVRTAALLEEYAIVSEGPEAPAASLSGGNQQRWVVARARALAAVAENPTRGLDLRATGDVHARLRRAAMEGAAVGQVRSAPGTRSRRPRWSAPSPSS